MRGIIIGISLSALLWWAIFAYGLEAIGLLIAFLAFAYIITTIWRDWTDIQDAPWEDGDPVDYGREK